MRIPRPSYPMIGERTLSAMAKEAGVENPDAIARLLRKILDKQAVDERANYAAIEQLGGGYRAYAGSGGPMEILADPGAPNVSNTTLTFVSPTTMPYLLGINVVVENEAAGWDTVVSSIQLDGTGINNYVVGAPAIYFNEEAMSVPDLDSRSMCTPYVLLAGPHTLEIGIVKTAAGGTVNVHIGDSTTDVYAIPLGGSLELDT